MKRNSIVSKGQKTLNPKAMQRKHTALDEVKFVLRSVVGGGGIKFLGLGLENF